MLFNKKKFQKKKNILTDIPFERREDIKVIFKYYCEKTKTFHQFYVLDKNI